MLTEADTEALAGLMLDAYVGTIDYEGENLEDARAEIEEYLTTDPILACYPGHRNRRRPRGRLAGLAK